MLKIKVIFLINLLCFAFTSGFALTPEDCEKKYHASITIDWQKKLGGQVPQKVLDLLNNGKFQEAIWELDDAIALDDADFSQISQRLKTFLHQQLSSGDVPKDSVMSLNLGGVTKSQSIHISPYGIKAVFKVKSHHPSSNYQAEIAAYKIDQLGMFRLVPMTVVRKVEGKTGSLQYFIRNAKTVKGNLEYRRSNNLNVFDYIIRNKDRNESNILLAERREIAIDHGLCLKPFNPLGQCLALSDKVHNFFHIMTHPVRQNILHPSTHPQLFIPDPVILNHLVGWNKEQLMNSLSSLLDEDAIDMLIEKKNKLLLVILNHHEK